MGVHANAKRFGSRVILSCFSCSDLLRGCGLDTFTASASSLLRSALRSVRSVICPSRTMERSSALLDSRERSLDKSDASRPLAPRSSSGSSSSRSSSRSLSRSSGLEPPLSLRRIIPFTKTGTVSSTTGDCNDGELSGTPSAGNIPCSRSFLSIALACARPSSSATSPDMLRTKLDQPTPLLLINLCMISVTLLECLSIGAQQPLQMGATSLHHLHYP
eukprot:2495192-Rhodomonas_salina.1